MGTEIREWIDTIWECCQEHWAAAVAAAAVILLVLLSVALARSAKRDDLEPSQKPEPVPEPEEPTAQAENEVPEEPIFQAENEVPEEPIFRAEKEVTEEPIAEAETFSAADSAENAVQGTVADLLRQMEAVSGAAGQKVESVQLKIEKAQLTINYVSDRPGSQTCTVCEELTAEEDFAAKEDFDGKDKPEEADGTDRETPEPGAREDGKEDRIVPKRFGIENMNTARSGRVYTEEELLHQIRE